jgi:hypothetical protein
MQVRYPALIIGVLFLILGLAGFVPSFVSIPDVPVATPINGPNMLNSGYGYLFGLFPINYLHNAIHLAVGILGIAAFTSVSGSLVFLRGFAIAYVLIALMGLIPLAKTLFGTMPIYGNNVWFNALTAIAAGYYGFISPTKAQNLQSASSI